MEVEEVVEGSATITIHIAPNRTVGVLGEEGGRLLVGIVVTVLNCTVRPHLIRLSKTSD